jgi:hypothetical protein
MHTVAAFVASIVTFVSGLFGSPLLASNSTVNVPAAQPAAVAAAQTEIIGDPFNDPDAVSAVVAAIPATAPAPMFSPPPAQTVINQPVIERIIERIVPQGGAMSAQTLAAILADFEQSISSRIAALNPPKAAISEQVAAPGNSAGYYFAPASQRIDQITNTAINTPTITGGAISGASSVGAASGSFDALSAGTLNLSGALTGTDATFSGVLTAGTLNVAGVSSGGAITGPYFTATSTTATSTFAGGFTAANNGFSILQNGNVGIGTAVPTAALMLVGDTNVARSIEVHNEYAVGLWMYTHSDQWFRGPSVALFKSRGTQANPTAVQAGDILGYYQFWGHNGTTYVNGPVMESVAAQNWSSGAAGSHLDFYTVVNGTNGVHNFVMRIAESGRVGIGTMTPTAQLSTTGTVRFAGLGSGGANLVTDSLGNVTVSSDERLKDKQGDFTRGLAAINSMSPVLYKWRPETGLDTQSTYAGFFAQDVQAAIPEAVSQDSRGYLTLADRPILAALVNAVKELAQRISDLASNVTTRELVADNGRFHNEICVDKSDGTPVCVTGNQLAAVLAATGQTAGSSSANATMGASHAPAIELNGNASSTIELGDTYNDLGARIVAPESDLNLGLTTILDGATTTQVSIDTSVPGTHEILYTVTSPTTGLTGSIMRTVIVSPATQSSEPPANDNPFNAAPANDNVSTSNLLNTEPAAVNL